MSWETECINTGVEGFDGMLIQLFFEKICPSWGGQWTQLWPIFSDWCALKRINMWSCSSAMGLPSIFVDILNIPNILNILNILRNPPLPQSPSQPCFVTKPLMGLVTNPSETINNREGETGFCGMCIFCAISLSCYSLITAVSGPHRWNNCPLQWGTSRKSAKLFADLKFVKKFTRPDFLN